MSTSPGPPESRSERAPDLKLVPESPAVEEGVSSPNPNPGVPTPPRRETDDRSSRGVPIWLAVLIVVLFALSTIWQVRQSGVLEAEIVGLESELEQSQALLGAYQTRLEEVRGSVYDLSDRLLGLRALVDAEPVTEP